MRDENRRGRRISSRTATDQVRAREAEALRLRAEQGLSYEEIARRTGYANESGARKAVARAMDRNAREPMDAAYALELSRLDALQKTVWTVLRTGTDHLKLKAVQQALAISQHRTRILGITDGRGAEITVSDLDREIARLTGEMAEVDRRRKVSKAGYGTGITGRDHGGTSVEDPAELAAVMAQIERDVERTFGEHGA